MSWGLNVGLSDLHYALLTKDDASGVTYEKPVRMAKAINAKIKVKSNTEVLYADDGPAETVTSLGEAEVELEVAALPLSVQAVLFGHHLEKGVLIRKASDYAPYISLGFKSEKSTGDYAYVWLYKGKFEPPEQEFHTKEDKIKFQPRAAKDKEGQIFLGFIPAVSTKSKKKMRQKIKEWKLYRKTGSDMEGLAQEINPTVNGWIQYYGQYYKSEMESIYCYLDRTLEKWCRRKYKRLKSSKKAWQWLLKRKKADPELFVHWRYYPY